VDGRRTNARSCVGAAAEERSGRRDPGGRGRLLRAQLVAHPRYPQVRELLLTSMRGVGLTYAFDPRDPRTDPHLRIWKDLARSLLE
jgi:hypothetical protein